LICDYNSPHEFEKYCQLKEDDKFSDEEDPDEKKDKDNDDNESLDEHGKTPREGESLIASDQSSITGESLAVDKYMGDVAYYTTGKFLPVFKSFDC
jgi:H+-transporting ATPase